MKAKQTSTPFRFTRQTFAYFEGAKQHADDPGWFETQRALYGEHVEVPMGHLVAELQRELAPLLPGIPFSARKISKPQPRQTRGMGGAARGPVLRTNVTAFFAETSASMFESNPGFYLSLGADGEDNVLGCGLYEPSSRQMKLLRGAFYADPKRLRTLLAAPACRRYWAEGLTGERYKRFPKDLDEHAPGAEYAWHKRLLLSRHPARAEITSPDFIPETVAAFVAAVPFITWLRATVGIYKRAAPGAERDQEL